MCKKYFFDSVTEEEGQENIVKAVRLSIKNGRFSNRVFTHAKERHNEKRMMDIIIINCSKVVKNIVSYFDDNPDLKMIDINDDYTDDCYKILNSLCN